jgi:RND family efflux transporter MFP subunit
VPNPRRASPCPISISAFCLIAGVCGCLLAGCEGGAPAAGLPAQPVAEIPEIEAEVLSVESTAWPTVVRTHGSLAANEIAIVGAKVAGRIAEVHVDLGDIVAAGDPLATLDQDECRLQVAQAEAHLNEASAAVGLRPGTPIESLDRKNAPPIRQEKALWDEAIENQKRGRDLLSRKLISDSEIERLDAAERVSSARYASAINAVEEKIAMVTVRMAELGLARQRLSDSIIRSPFDGRVQLRHVAPGEYVPIGHAVATVVRDHPLRFRGTISERYARDLSVGRTVMLRVESLPEPRAVQITRISPVLDETSRSRLFESLVDNTDGRLQSGLFAEGDVVIGPDARALVVPSSAVTEFAGVEKVWKVVEGMSREQPVRTGQRRADQVEIVSGLTEGDVILRHAEPGRVARISPIVRVSAEQTGEPSSHKGKFPDPLSE